MHPSFYIVLLALLVAKAVTVGTGLVGNGPQPRSPNVAVGVRMGLLPEGVQNGFPAPLTLDGSTCLSLPPQYNFSDAGQRSNIPVTYGLMHAALLCLVLMPIPLCHTGWTALVGWQPSLRHWVPVNDFVYVHRLLGLLCIGLIALGATVWLVTMVPACAAEPKGKACLAFARGGADGTQFDPLRNVLILRLIVAPLWGAVLPLMMAADKSWQRFEAGAKEQKGLARQLVYHARDPVVVWLWFVPVAIGLAGGAWAEGSLGATVGAVCGAVAGLRLATSALVRLHWYEFVLWQHRAVAYSSILLALVARFDVFWPCAATWLLFALDKTAQARATSTLFIDALESRCIEDSRGKPSKLRLVLNVRSTTASRFARNAASQWVYLSVPEMFSSASSRLTRAVGRAWHPLSLAAQSDSKVELLIDVHPRLNGRQSWSEHLFAHVSQLQQNAVHVSASRAMYATPLRAYMRGPFGSAFDRCFEMVRRPGQVDAPRHDIVVLFGSGIGLPSALSALHEFIRRRRAGVLVPRFVLFMWQCRTTEELQLCWDSLHRLIFGAKGMCDAQTHQTERQALARGQRVPLDYEKHTKRNPRFRGGDKVRLEGRHVVHVASGHRVDRVDSGAAEEATEHTLPTHLRAPVGDEVKVGGATFVNVGVPWDDALEAAPDCPLWDDSEEDVSTCPLLDDAPTEEALLQSRLKPLPPIARTEDEDAQACPPSQGASKTSLLWDDAPKAKVPLQSHLKKLPSAWSSPAHSRPVADAAEAKPCPPSHGVSEVQTCPLLDDAPTEETILQSRPKQLSAAWESPAHSRPGAQAGAAEEPCPPSHVVPEVQTCPLRDDAPKEEIRLELPRTPPKLEHEESHESEEAEPTPSPGEEDGHSSPSRHASVACLGVEAEGPASPPPSPPAPLDPSERTLAPMLDWLGVSLHVSSWKRDAQLELDGRDELLCDNPLQTEDPAAERVHRWLCSRLRAGYHDLSAQLEELDALDHEYSPHQTEPRRLCVSMCGSQRALLETKRHMAKAKAKLRGQTDVSFELAADYHG